MISAIQWQKQRLIDELSPAMHEKMSSAHIAVSAGSAMERGAFCNQPVTPYERSRSISRIVPVDNTSNVMQRSRPTDMVLRNMFICRCFNVVPQR